MAGGGGGCLRPSLTRMRNGEASKASHTSDLSGLELFWENSAEEEGVTGVTLSRPEANLWRWEHTCLRVATLGTVRF